MHSEAVIQVIADELRQQHWLSQTLKPRDWHETVAADSDECVQRFTEYQREAVIKSVRTLEPADIPHRCYTVYQMCVYESVARGEEFSLFPNKLVLQTCHDGEQLHLRLTSADALHEARDYWKQLQERTPECDPDVGRPIALDLVIEGALAKILGELRAPERYCSDRPTDFEHLAEEAARHCFQAIGSTLLAALSTGRDVQAAFLGTLKWPGGESAEVSLRPSQGLLDHLAIFKLRQRRARRRTADHS